jgi:CubicO group peptidase (beta-lactamase class C family)
MAKILISYRRADTDAIAGRIRDRLADHYGDDAVFMDIEDIPFGIDFREQIKAEFANGDVLLAVVGPRWLGPQEGGGLRMSDPSDPVRTEIEFALQKKIPVIPVLVHDAAMPAAGALPDSIKGFAYHNAAEVDTGRDFHPHVDRLIKSIDEVLRSKGKGGRRLHQWLAGGIAAACAALIAAGAFLYQGRTTTPPPGPAPAPSLAIASPPGTPPQVPQAQVPVPSAGQQQSARGRAPSWRAHHRVAATEFPALRDALAKDGYRLRSITPYTADGAEQFACLWIRDGGPDLQVRVGLGHSDFREAGEDLLKQGFHTTWIAAHEFEGELRYVGIYEKTELPERRLRFGINSTQLRSTLEAFTKEGFHPVHIYGYAVAGVANFATIFEKGEGQAPVTFDINPAEFQKFIDEQNKLGFRPKMLSAYRVGGGELRAGLWEKAPGAPWFSRTGALIPSYLSLYDNMLYQGYRPVALSVASIGSTVRANSIWESIAYIGELNAITSRMQNYLRTYQVPGVAIAITKDDRLVYAAGFGQAERETNSEATPTRPFRIAGVSKAITAIAILKLVEAKKLSLDDKVFGPGGHLGGRYPTPPSNRKIERITVRHLLAQTSGFGNSPNNPVTAYADLAPAEMIRAVIEDPARALARDPGAQFEPSDFGYIVLGRVIEQVTGKSYQQFVRAEVLTPAGLPDMRIGGDTATAKQAREVTYYPAEAYSQRLTNMDAANGWVASAVELARLLVHVDGSPGKPDIISADSRQLMITSAGSKGANGEESSYGLGWLADPQSQTGAMPGTLAYVAVLPGNFTVVALVNTLPSGDPTGEHLGRTLRDIVGAVKGWPSFDLFENVPTSSTTASR